MKRILSFALSALFLLALCSCSNSSIQQTNQNTTPTTSANTVKVTYTYCNGLADEVYYVNVGALAPKPKVPVPAKEHCTFVTGGTRKDHLTFTCDTPWNFEKDTVKEEITLYAHYTLKDDFYTPEANAEVLKGGADVRIMSFNVLATEWASPTNEKPSGFDRFPYFKNVLDRYAPDVVGVQEFNIDWYTSVMEYYDRYKVINEDNKVVNGTYNYSTIVYNTDKVELLEYGQDPYPYNDNKNTAKVTWGYFRSKATDKRFIVISTHWSLSDFVDAKQSSILAAKVKSLQEQYSVPVICTGDYNSNDAGYINKDGNDSVLTQFFEESGFTDAKYAARDVGLLSHTLHKGDGEFHPKGEIGVGSYIDVNVNQTNSIDHILCPINVVPTYYDTVIDEDALQASDHCPIYADFIIE